VVCFRRSTISGARVSGLNGFTAGHEIKHDGFRLNANNDRFPELTAECLRLKPDVIAVTTTPAARLSKNATRDIPVVMVALGDPVGTGLVESLAKPGGNLTGMSQMVPELAAKRLALLKDAVLGITRVLVLTFLTDPIAPLQVAALTKAAPSLGITFKSRTFGPLLIFLRRLMLESNSGRKGCSRRRKVSSSSMVRASLTLRHSTSYRRFIPIQCRS
jgi:hypothetical protein